MNGPTFAPALAAPRPAPPRPLARPAAKPDGDGNGLRVLTYLQLHWLMILFCGTLLGAVGSYAAWELLASKYESYGLLQVSQVPPALAHQGNAQEARTDFTTYVRTMSGLIKSEFVLNAAMRDLKDLPTVKAQKDPIKYLGEEVLVGAPDGSEVIRVSMASHNPADANKIVNAVQKAFLAEVVQKEVATKQARFRQSEQAMQDMQKRLENMSRGHTLAKAPGDGVTPVQAVEGTPGVLPPGVAPPAAAPAAVSGLELMAKLDPRALVSRLAALQMEVDRTLPIEIGAGKARMRELEGQIEALKRAPLDPATLAAVDNDQQVVDQSMQVRRAKANHDFAASAGRPDAPDVVNLRRVYEAQNARLAEVRREKAGLLEGGRRAAEGKLLFTEWTTVKNQVARYETQLATARISMANLERMLNNLPQAAEVVRTDGRGGLVPPSYDPADTDLRSRDGMYARLITQHEALKLDLLAGQRIQLLQPASSPMQKDIKKQVLGTVAGGLFGYFLVALGVVAFETVSRRVSSLADLKSVGPAPVVGVIPGLPTDATGRDPARRAAANEAIDKLRAYVAQTWLSRGATCVAVTSPLGDEGKAFTAFGLASSLAQAGYKTLLADFDLREPALHTYAGVPNTVGACEVLRGETDPRSAVVTLPSGLAFLPAGKWSDEARQAAVGGRLEAVLAKLKEPFDCVILHGHALLTVAESVAVARRCEVVLVCARYRETKLPLLEKATDRVAAMEIPYSGVVYVGATETEALC
ncbi:tyrosine-protein kinase domain-containing protein [Urbifossiella limnaea]|uniref:Tyrosine-protein kinase ptk n=1 Tax=Urbifossiella limnaea TaxID=2528023 RepID=A0A517XRP7_9BACT|nr:hypothetical protein [Urbifossiella limnaea]QDU20185.1 Tyrosine-protein kinase ptk [Urbifossiella limnaea]